MNVRPRINLAAFLLFAEFCVTVYSDHIPSIAESRACSCRMATARGVATDYAESFQERWRLYSPSALSVSDVPLRAL